VIVEAESPERVVHDNNCHRRGKAPSIEESPVARQQQHQRREGHAERQRDQLDDDERDLVGEWQARDKLLIAAVSQSPEGRSSPGEAAERARLTAIDARLRDIDRTLAVDFPEYAALTNPEPQDRPSRRVAPVHACDDRDR
jgi:hypothetical protein